MPKYDIRRSLYDMRKQGYNIPANIREIVTPRLVRNIMKRNKGITEREAQRRAIAAYSTVTTKTYSPIERNLTLRGDQVYYAEKRERQRRPEYERYGQSNKVGAGLFRERVGVFGRPMRPQYSVPNIRSRGARITDNETDAQAAKRLIAYSALTPAEIAHNHISLLRDNMVTAIDKAYGGLLGHTLTKVLTRAVRESTDKEIDRIGEVDLGNYFGYETGVNLNAVIDLLVGIGSRHIRGIITQTYGGKSADAYEAFYDDLVDRSLYGSSSAAIPAIDTLARRLGYK